MGIAARLVALALNVYRRYRRWALALQGLTEGDASYRNVASGDAWAEFCDQLKGAGAAILAPGAPRDALTQAEAYRYLSRLMRGGLENFVEASDPLAPRLVTIANGLREAPVKLGSDSPDNLYENAPIDGTRTYRVSGARGTVAYLGIGVQAGSYGAPGGLRTVSYAESAELAQAPPPAGTRPGDFDGGYLEVFIAPERPAGALNWLRSAADPSEGQLLVRHTFLDRSAETPARLTVELVCSSSLLPSGCDGGAHTGPPNLTPERIEAGLRKTALLVAGAPLMFNGWIGGFMAHTNTLPLFDVERSNRAGGDPNIRYYHSYWRVSPGEALVIDANPPPCDNWNFVLCNHWMVRRLLLLLLLLPPQLPLMDGAFTALVPFSVCRSRSTIATGRCTSTSGAPPTPRTAPCASSSATRALRSRGHGGRRCGSTRADTARA